MYTPKLKDENVRKLYQLKQRVRKPMTELINEAVEMYLMEQFKSMEEQSNEN